MYVRLSGLTLRMAWGLQRSFWIGTFIVVPLTGGSDVVGLSPGCHISCMGSCVVLSFSMVQYTVVCTPSAAASTGLFSVTGF